MATLTAIAFNLVGSLSVFSVTMVAFGCAVKSQNTFIAARCTARPPTVIYNPSPTRHPSQNRGNPSFGWILWVMRLTYDTMLRGVPGTGTREGGLSGSLLKVNLDGIVLLRFHHLGLRVCTLAMGLYLIVVLPLYATAQCSRIGGGGGNSNSNNSSSSNDDYYYYYYNFECQPPNNNLTDYQRLTLANIPILEPEEAENLGDVFRNWFSPSHDGLMARLYAVVVCAWIVTSYALRELQVEWGDVLAMRRVYYLEADHWTDRRDELEQSRVRVRHNHHPASHKRNHDNNHHNNHDNHHEHGVGEEQEQKQKQKQEQERTAGSVNSAVGGTSATSSDTADESYLTDRKPWIPHPEQRDTVPNIELYSVLVGGLPSLPTEVVVDPQNNAEDLFFSRKQSIDWQLSVTTAFFDHCVPNQPGFSSSIAAVTILPSAQHLTEAWNQWYNVAGKLRRLRFIRDEIAQRKKREAASTGGGNKLVLPSPPEGSILETVPMQMPIPMPMPMQMQMQMHWEASPTKPETPTTHQPPNINSPPPKKISSYRATSPEEKKKYYQEVLGSTDDLEVESKLLCALHFGPEQTASYSREFALGAANLAPYGWNESRITGATLEQLYVMEHDAVEQVQDANAALREAQERIAEDAEDLSDEELSNEELQLIMRTASMQGTGGTGLRNSFCGLGTLDEEEGLPSSNPLLSSSRHSMRSGGLRRSRHTSQYSDSPPASLGDETDDNDSFCEDSLSGSSYATRLNDHTNNQSATPGNKEGSGDNQSNSLDGGSCHSRNGSGRRRYKRSGSIDTARSSCSGDRSEDSRQPKRSSILTDVGMSVMKMTGLKRVSSSVSIDTLSSRPKRASKKASIVSAQLPSDLGLEAGLWMEQNNLSRHGSQHISRSRSIASGRKKSSLSESMHGIHEPRFNHKVQGSAPKRTRSSDDINAFFSIKEDSPTSFPNVPGIPKRSAPKRTLSSDDVDLLGASWNPEKPLKVTPLNTPAKRPSRTPSLQSAYIGATHDNSASKRGSILDMVPTKSAAASGSNSIWVTLEKDKERKQKLRDRLSRMQDSAELSKIDKPISLTRFDPLAGSDKSGEGDASPRLPRREVEPQQARTPKPQPQTEMPTPQHTILNHQVQGGSSNDPYSYPPPIVKSLDEAMAEDDTSVDMDSVMAAAKVYGRQQHTFEASWTSQHFVANAGLRHREGAPSITSRVDELIEAEDKWSRVMAIVQESSRDQTIHHATKERLISSGQWMMPTRGSIVFSLKKRFSSLLTSLQDRLKPPEIVDALVKDSSYAVVTFTSRQAAVAARHCLADSRGHDRWVTVSEVPSPPLADAPACNISGFRGCVRPVTLSISDKQKILRHTLALATLACVYFFYTIPLTAAQQLVSPKKLSNIFPDIESLQESSVLLSNIFSGFIPALIWTAFFAVCPPMFKIIANFGSNATSSVAAENSALKYFWWFMLFSAFTGTSFSTAVINGFNEGLNLGTEIQKVIEKTALTIPTQVSATWLNWMIIRVFAVLPTQYLLQLNTFIFTALGLKCCARSVRGGGAGGPVPYRIYVDSGVVMLCLFALAPASPLIAPAAFTYFLLCTPLLRWTMIFLYKPKFDIGGGRFPFLFDICISGMVVGQILLVTMMALKRAIGPAIAAFCPMIPTIWFRHFVRRRYLLAFNDAALLQTSLLDGWDTNEESSEENREDYRKFLVDCHKAAYVPVCIAGDESAMITAEPAVVVPVEFDEEHEHSVIETEARGEGSSYKSDQVSIRLQQQPGAMARRPSSYRPISAMNAQMGAGMRRASAMIQQRGISSERDIEEGSMTSSQAHIEVSRLSSHIMGSPRRRAGKQIISHDHFASPQRKHASFKVRKFPESLII